MEPFARNVGRNFAWIVAVACVVALLIGVSGPGGKGPERMPELAVVRVPTFGVRAQVRAEVAQARRELERLKRELDRTRFDAPRLIEQLNRQLHSVRALNRRLERFLAERRQ